MAAPTSPPRQPQPQPQQQQQPQSGPEAIKRTMEYYFSDKNLVRDRFMHTKMAEDTTGEKWVRLDVLLTFPKLRKLVHEECKSEDQDVAIATLVTTLAGSTQLQIRDDEQAVRRSPSLPPPPPPPPAADAPLKHLVLDSGAIIKGVGISLTTKAEQFWTVPEVLAEIRDKRARAALASLPFTLEEKEPSHDAMVFMSRFAQQTGDYGTLSKTDLKVLALSYMLEKQESGDAHLRQEPKNAKKLPTPTKKAPAARPGTVGVPRPAVGGEGQLVAATGAAVAATPANGGAEAEAAAAKADAAAADSDEDGPVIEDAEEDDDWEPPAAAGAGASAATAATADVAQGGGQFDDAEEDLGSDDDWEPPSAAGAGVEEEKGENEQGGGINWDGDEDDMVMNDEDFEFDTARVQPSYAEYCAEQERAEKAKAAEQPKVEFKLEDDSLFPTLGGGGGGGEGGAAPAWGAKASGGAPKMAWGSSGGVAAAVLAPPPPDMDDGKKGDAEGAEEAEKVEAEEATAAAPPGAAASETDANVADAADAAADATADDDAADADPDEPSRKHSDWNRALKKSGRRLPKVAKGDGIGLVEEVEYGEEATRPGLGEELAADGEGGGAGEESEQKTYKSRMMGMASIGISSQAISNFDDDGSGWVNPSNVAVVRATGSGMDGSKASDLKSGATSASNTAPSASPAAAGSTSTSASAAATPAATTPTTPAAHPRAGGSYRKSAPLIARSACVTTDFAMQNVLLQVGLKLLSVEGFEVRRVKQYVLRCNACFNTVADTNKLFCGRCGSSFLSRVPCGVDQRTGEQRVFLKPGYQHKTQGTKYSLPKAGSIKAKGGRFEGDMLLREDQLMMGIWSQKTRAKAQEQSSMFGADVTEKTGLSVKKGANITVGSGRRNPNAMKNGRERRGAKKRAPKK